MKLIIEFISGKFKNQVYKLKNYKYLYLLKIFFNKKTLKIKFIEEFNSSFSSKNNYIYKTNNQLKKFVNKKFDKYFKNIIVLESRLEYEFYLLKEVFTVPTTDIIFDSINIYISDKEKFTKGWDFFKLMEFDSFKQILIGKNKHYLNFYKNNKCIISNSLFKSSYTIPEGINLLSSIDNYWHFIFEQAPKILLSNYLNIPKEIPFLLPDNLHPNIYEVINLLNDSKDRRRIIKVPINRNDPIVFKVDKLYIIKDHINQPFHIPRSTNLLNCKFFFDKIPILDLAKKIKRILKVEKEIDYNLKLFLYRDSVWRVSKDQENLKNLLLKKGYTLFNPSKLSFKEQVKLCSKASSFIGFSGAGYTNSIFLPKESKKLIFVNDYYLSLVNIWDHLLENLYICKNGNNYNDCLEEIHGEPYLTEENWIQLDEFLSI